MAGNELRAVLRYLRRTVGPKRAGASDAELLDKFLDCRDQSAFELLVWRHERMVLGVCRRLLHDEHAAEDAFQATFLTLLRKARSITKHGSVASWLYKVAYRIALTAKARRARQVQHEKEAGYRRAKQRGSEESSRTGDDLQPVLDEELSRLPEKYRAPFVLCYLEGKSYDEAARELGWPKGTVATRLSEARQKLRARLTRRGITLSASALASLLASHAAEAAVPHALVSCILEAALLLSTGQALTAVVEPQVVALMEGAVKAMVIAKVKIAAVVLMVGAALGTGAGAIAYRGVAADDKAASKQESPKPSEPKRTETAERRKEDETKDRPIILSASGQVVDQAGKPVAGATVYLREWTQIRGSDNVHRQITDVLATATTDETGRFAFEDVRARPLGDYWRGQQQPWDIVVLAKGHGAAWKRLTLKNQKQPMAIQLRPEEILIGRVLDPDGKPAGGLILQVFEITAPHLPMMMGHTSENHLNLNWSKLWPRATTDKGGNFAMAGLPKEMRVGILVADRELKSGYDRQGVKGFFYAVTSDKPQAKLINPHYSGQREEEEREVPVYSNNLTFTLPRPHPGRVKGRVVFENTGKPAAGVRVSADRPGQVVETVTDPEGRYVLEQVPVGNWRLWAGPPEKSDYLSISVNIELSRDSPEKQRDLQLPSGAIVTGRAVDEETGQGISGLKVFWSRGEATYDATGPNASYTSTAADGRFRIAVPPGKGKVRLTRYIRPSDRHDPDQFKYALPEIGEHYWKEMQQSGFLKPFVRDIDAKPGQPLTGVDFKISRSASVTGRVLDAQGKPVQGAQVQPNGHRAKGSHFTPEDKVTTDGEGKFVIPGLRFDARFYLFILDKERKLGVVHVPTLPVDKKQTDLGDIRLKPVGKVTGTVVGEDSRPLAGVAVHAQSTVRLGNSGFYFMPEECKTITDEAGKFAVDYLVDGLHYQIIASHESYVKFESESFMVRSSQTHQLGRVTLQKGDQSIGGVVVDLAGNPVPGAHLFVGNASGRRLEVAGDEPHQDYQSDSNGRFHITGLPRGTVTIMAHVRSAPNQPAHVRTETGKRNLRLVLNIPGISPEQKAAVSKPAPQFAVAKWLRRDDPARDRSFFVEDYRNKVIVLAFLDNAKPSQRLLPQLDRLHEKYAKQGLVIIRIYERADEPEWAKQSPTSAALVKPSEAFQKYGVKVTPALFLIDKKGVLRYADMHLDKLESAIEELLTK